jgi:Holliday junction resolvase RusA-like endonuclease
VVAAGECRTCKAKKPCNAKNCFRGLLARAAVTDQQGAELKAWRQLTMVRAMSARNAAGQRLVKRPGALAISIVFVMPRPDGHWTDSGALTSAGRTHLLPTVKPDVDKLTRACLDGCVTGILAEDDAQVVSAPPAKVYANWRGWTGVVVHARQVSGYDAWVERELAHHGVWTAPGVTQGALL